MLTIRFARVGKKNKAQFKIMLQERTVAPGGRHVEILGSWDPHHKTAVLKEDRIKYWVGKGAHVSDTAYNLFVTKGVLEGKKRAVKLPAKKAEETAVEETKPESQDTKDSNDKEVKKEAGSEEIKKEDKAEKKTTDKEEIKPEEKSAKEETIEEKPAEEAK